ncbi:hypothetical protein A3L14_05735 [Thermococcus thioreducens]|uniref:Adhesin domain-containing protein n=2 Tax=Thermococcus thioreducens TaxID=277988 RepID=A0A0Q2M5H0_9EURY|nr:DUF4097 family beta strand repeat-containing protein [Thermococcus thioreducens]ASJ12424.1 hypothetical protein A3L14_05735 [Thermococcus thioreducens]KQH83154.1 hypothetical protein AMR53_02740 [Thermococcus thioreducens]SEV91096.1 hypothetical protein SAMN05216170_0808 [Thermococcus thioreducens]
MIFENVKKVELNTFGAQVKIEGWENDYVEVNYVLHGEVNVSVEQRGSRLIIKEEWKKKFFNLLRKGGWAEIEVKVPKSVVVKARNVNGEITARDVRLTEATTVNGTIELEECEAELLKSVNGEINAHLATAGPLKASIVNGTLGLTIEELEDDVEVSTVNGDIVLRLTDFCDARIVSSRVNGEVKLVGIDPNDPVIGAGTYRVKASTVNGGVRVELI